MSLRYLVAAVGRDRADPGAFVDGRTVRSELPTFEGDPALEDRSSG